MSILSAESPLSNVPLQPSESALSSSIPPSVPSRIPGSSLPADTTLSFVPAASDSSSNPRSPPNKDQRKASSGSQNASSTAQASKSVAFAPSPQKQRSASPAQSAQLSRLAISQPLSRTSSNDNPFNAGSSFARPTAASQARARTWTRSAASDASHNLTSSNAHISREKGSSSHARSSKSSHASGRSTNRRSYSYSSGPTSSGEPSNAFCTPSNVESRTRDAPISIGRGASFDIAYSGRASPIKSSDPARDPLQFPTRTSVPMRTSYSGSTSSRATSRRNSVDPVSPTGSMEPVAFPDFGRATARSFCCPTWSEMTHEELVRNLGPRERTRQEVLWEIVASEERYVIELEKARDLYIDALIHPEEFDPERVLPPPAASIATSPIGGSGNRDWSSTPQAATLSHGKLTANASGAKIGSEMSSNGDLPIAARFMSDVSATRLNSADSAIRNTRSQWDAQHAAGSRSPYSTSVSGAHPRIDASFGLGLGLGTTATRDRSTPGYMSVPLPIKSNNKVSKAQKLRSLSSKSNTSDSDPFRLTVPLPPSLREVLIAISEGLVKAHGLLSDALKARYEEQWPLVRSLADVFMKYSHILEHYASYVCHLQRAMEELEEAALMERAFRGKRLKKERLSNTVGLGRTVAALEACAASYGYAGLSIFSSMPFQRLLKYPLLFQNLLFHTDPSTHEFESTVAMVVEVERLVRSIEDEKVGAEERDKIRDCFARIDGITDRRVLRPRSDRMLIEEMALYDEHARRTLSESAPKDTYMSDSEGGESATEGNGSTQRGGRSGSTSINASGLRAALRNKRSYRRLSDFLSSEHTGSSKAPSMGSKKDLWLVRFSDVEIKCQRIGVTALPMISTAALRNIADNADAAEASDFTARTKDSRERLKALRNTTLRAKTRNLYKFVSVVAWRNATSLRQGEWTKDDLTDGLPTSHEVDEEDDEDEDADDGSSVSSASSSVTCSSYSGSSGGVEGQVANGKYVRSTKLSFTYWGDRIEPSRGIAGVQASTAPNAQAKASGRRSDPYQASRATYRTTTAATTDAAFTTATTGATTNSNSVRRPRGSTPQHKGNRAALRTTKPGVSGRLSEPLSSTSMSTAPESMQTAVAQMHARQRNDKFGARLRSSMPNGNASTASVDEAAANGSHVSVNLASGEVREGADGTAS
ncbi:uncharacterized protein MEPE_02257 [Melanopsichium pennsylvanicum]|uniref:DH domain-containing protein n=2 Tax=Melanopsichium pennsylvanicum TaxID=63383 RepID=A0AAJ5C4C5_9BASI|nr:uncharacterized protein MEPE_02257 [Melanopsichium pennsylvanicum]